MIIHLSNTESPLLSFLIFNGERHPNRLRATAVNSKQTWNFHYLHDFLVSRENVDEVLAIAKILDITTGTNSKEDLEVFMLYLDSKYPTYSYH